MVRVGRDLAGRNLVERRGPVEVDLGREGGLGEEGSEMARSERQSTKEWESVSSRKAVSILDG